MRMLTYALGAAAALAIVPVAIALADDPTPPAPAAPAPSDAPPARLAEPPAPPAQPQNDAPPAAAPAPATSADGCRVEVIPAHRQWVERPVTVPAVTCDRQVPVFETVSVPVTENRCVPEYRDQQFPTYATREVPVYEERQVPEYGQVPVTVYREEKDPVKVDIPNPFSCDCGKWRIKLWDRCKKVPCGTELRPGVVGWHTEPVACGTRTESFQSGMETRKVVAGWHDETVTLGQRTEERMTGYRTETTVVEPERTTTVRECVEIPAQAVTVTKGDPAKAKQLPGTAMVVTEDQFARTVATIR